MQAHPGPQQDHLGLPPQQPAEPAETSAGTQIQSQKALGMSLASQGLAAALGMLPDPGDAYWDLGRAAQRGPAPVTSARPSQQT